MVVSQQYVRLILNNLGRRSFHDSIDGIDEIDDLATQE